MQCSPVCSSVAIGAVVPFIVDGVTVRREQFRATAHRVSGAAFVAAELIKSLREVHSLNPMRGVSVRHHQAAARAHDTLASDGPDSIPESGVRRVPVAQASERAALDYELLWVPPPHRSAPPPRKHRLRLQRELPVRALVSGTPQAPALVNPDFAAEPPTPFCALDAPMLVFSNDRLLASVTPPPFEPIPMRLQRRVEGWMRQLERLLAHALSRCPLRR